VTTTLQHPVRPAPAGRATPHKVLAKAGLYVFLLANAAFVTYLFNAAGVGSNKLINFGRLAGLYGRRPSWRASSARWWRGPSS